MQDTALHIDFCSDQYSYLCGAVVFHVVVQHADYAVSTLASIDGLVYQVVDLWE